MGGDKLGMAQDGIEHKPTEASFTAQVLRIGGLGFARQAFEGRYLRKRIQRLRVAKATAEKIELGADEIMEDDVIIDERYHTTHTGTYGISDKQTIEAICHIARVDAFISNPVHEDVASSPKHALSPSTSFPGLIPSQNSHTDVLLISTSPLTFPAPSMTYDTVLKGKSVSFTSTQTNGEDDDDD
ncbi:hypothetical protein F5051DRAFT_444915 [Lentinula edodes]|nr:hypothetical protein F5051DRAFT_444915 [Lentinula edodes]